MVGEQVDQAAQHGGGVVDARVGALTEEEGQKVRGSRLLQLVDNTTDVRVWGAGEVTGLYSSVKSLQRRRLESRNRNNTE